MFFEPKYSQFNSDTITREGLNVLQMLVNINTSKEVHVSHEGKTIQGLKCTDKHLNQMVS